MTWSCWSGVFCVFFRKACPSLWTLSVANCRFICAPYLYVSFNLAVWLSDANTGVAHTKMLFLTLEQCARGQGTITKLIGPVGLLPCVSFVKSEDILEIFRTTAVEVNVSIPKYTLDSWFQWVAFTIGFFLPIVAFMWTVVFVQSFWANRGFMGHKEFNIQAYPRVRLKRSLPERLKKTFLSYSFIHPWTFSFGFEFFVAQKL